MSLAWGFLPQLQPKRREWQQPRCLSFFVFAQITARRITRLPSLAARKPTTRGTRGNGARPILTLQKQDVTSRKPVLQDFFSLERACYVRDVNADGRTREGVAKGRKQLMRTLSDRGKAIRYISRLQKGCLAARLFGCNVSREAHSPHFYFVPFLPNSHMLPLSPESVIVMYRSLLIFFLILCELEHVFLG